MAQSDNLLWMQAPELANARRRQQLGQQLMQAGGDSSPIQSPWQGVARLAQALIGGYESRKGREEIADYGAAQKDELARFLAEDGGAAPRMASPGVAQDMPTAPATPRQPMAAGPVNPDEDVLVRTTWGEGRGEPPVGQAAIAAVMRNRARLSGMSLADVAKQPGQFEPWGNPQTRAQMEALDPNGAEYQRILTNIRSNPDDPTGGATHFYSPTAQAALGRQTPAWATGEGKDIGRHRFFALPFAGKAPGGADPNVTPVAGPGGGAGQTGPVGVSNPDSLDQAQRLMRRAQAAAASNNPLIQRQAPMLAQQADLARQIALARQPREVQPTEAERLAVASGLVPGTPAYQAALRAALDRKGGPLVSIQNTGESKYEAERAQTLGARVKEWEDASVKSAQSLTRLSTMEKYLDQFTTGLGSSAMITAGQLAARLGVPEATLKGLNIDAGTTATGEGIRSLASQLLVGMIGSGGFPANNFSNPDREMLEKSLPGLANSPQGNKIIINVMRAAAQRDLEIGRAWRDWSKTNGDTLQSVRGFQAEVLPKIVERDIVAPILEQGGWVETPTAAPGGATPPPQQGAGPQPGMVENGYRFRGGNPGDPKSWERVQ
jgi:spore germination cell wall hydrolase CwlJ-like protein